MVAPVELNELEHDERLRGRLKLGPGRSLDQNLTSESSNLPAADAQLDEASWLASTQIVSQQLADSLWQHLAFARLVHESGHRGIDHIIRSASESHAQLVGWYRELQEYYEAILQTTVSDRRRVGRKWIIVGQSASEDSQQDQFAGKVLCSAPLFR